MTGVMPNMLHCQVEGLGFDLGLEFGIGLT